MNAGSHGNARKRWTDRLNRFDQSGLTVAQFCKQEHSLASFYQWRRKLRGNKFIRSTGPTFVPVPVPVPVPLPIPDAANPSFSPQVTVSLDLPGGIRLRIEVPADLSTTDKQEATP